MIAILGGGGKGSLASVQEGGRQVAGHGSTRAWSITTGAAGTSWHIKPVRSTQAHPMVQRGMDYEAQRS